MHRADPRSVKSRSVSPRKDRNTPRDVDIGSENAIQQTQLVTPHTPPISPHEYSQTPRSKESGGEDASQQTRQWRTPNTPHFGPQKYSQTSKSKGFSGEDAVIQKSERKTPNTPYFSPRNNSKIPQSGGSSRRGSGPSQLDYQKRKRQQPSPGCKESPPEKVSKRCNSGNFADSMIRQWCNHVGIQSPLLPRAEQQEYKLAEEMKQISTLKDLKIQKLMKKLETAEESVSSLTGRLQAEQEASMEILKELNTDEELISNYCRELAEGLKGFQKHKDILTEMYNVIKFNQTNFIVKLQNDLNAMKLKGEEYEKTVNTIRNQVMQKNQRIQELEITEAELKGQLGDMEKSMLEGNQLLKIHADEKLELTKKWENLTSTNRELQIQLQRIEEEKQELANVSAEKDDEIMNLKKEIDANRNKIESLLGQNNELSKENEKLIKMKERLMAELRSKGEEIEGLTNNINTREEIESKLNEELKSNQNEYDRLRNNYANLENELRTARADNLNLERSLKDVRLNGEKKIYELNTKIRVLEMEKDRVNSEKSSNAKEIENYYKSREEKYKAEIEKLKEDYDDKLKEIKKIEEQNSALIKSREEHRAEIEELKRNYDTKLTEMNEKNKIVQEQESFEKLQKYLKEREEKRKLENARIKRAMRDAENLEKYLKERDENLLEKEEEMFEKQQKDIKDVTYDHKYGDRQKDGPPPFESVEKYQKENKSNRSRREKEELYEQPKSVKEKEENENVAKVKKRTKVVKVESVAENKFDQLLKCLKEKNQNELTKDSPIKVKRALRVEAKSVTESVTTELVKEMGDQYMEVELLPEGTSKNSFADIRKGTSSLPLEDIYEFTYKVEQEHSQSQRETQTSKGTLSQFNERIDKIKGTNENENAPSPRKIFTTGVRRYSRPKSQTRKWGRFE